MSTTENVTPPAGQEAEEPQAQPPPTQHHQIVVVGGGTAGIAVAAKLCRKLRDPDLAIVEPSEHHYFQPQWTLVGGGVMPKEESRRPQRQVTPRKATWIRDSVAAFHPTQNQVELAGGGRIGYDYLVVAPGLQLNLERHPRPHLRHDRQGRDLLELHL